MTKLPSLIDDNLLSFVTRESGVLQLPLPFADFDESIRPIQLYQSLVARRVTLACTRYDRLDQLDWKFPERSIPLTWLDDWAASLPSDRLKSLHHAVDLRSPNLEDDLFLDIQTKIIPKQVRRQRGEFYTPAWLANHVIETCWDIDQQWLDPAVGAGAFALALGRKARRSKIPYPNFMGFDRNPWAVLCSIANFLRSKNACESTPQTTPIPLAIHDPLREDRAWRDCRATRIVGNPPWVLWDAIQTDERAQSANLWQRYGLRTETGMASILGSGKRDISLLLLLLSADRWLDDNGQLAFVLPLSTFKATRSSRGLRRWQLPDQTPLAVLRVDDLSRLKPFKDASVKSAVALISKGKSTEYPVPYFVWTSESVTEALPHKARPRTDDILSSWSQESVECESVIKPVTSKTHYRIRLGINTGGANGIYWLLRKSIVTPSDWLMQNLAHRGKRRVDSRDVLLESKNLYPILLGKDLAPWNAKPSAWVLLVQDPIKRAGIEPGKLAEQAPLTWEYLHSFEEILRNRAAYRRFFQRTRKDGGPRDAAPFYSMFNIGPYTWSPWKVVWNRMGHRLAVDVVGAIDGKPIMPQETHCFIGTDSEDEAMYLAALFSSRWVQQTLERGGDVGGKSFATPGAFEGIRLDPFDPTSQLHQRLIELGIMAQNETKFEGHVSDKCSSQIDNSAADYWNISASVKSPRGLGT